MFANSLTIVNSHNYLVLTVESQLSLKEHIGDNITKTIKSVGLVKCTLLHPLDF